MKLPSGWIYRPIVDRKGINITLERTDLVLCKDCRYFRTGSRDFSNRCRLHDEICPDSDWFCADGEEEEE